MGTHLTLARDLGGGGERRALDPQSGERGCRGTDSLPVWGWAGGGGDPAGGYSGASGAPAGSGTLRARAPCASACPVCAVSRRLVWPLAGPLQARGCAALDLRSGCARRGGAWPPPAAASPSTPAPGASPAPQTWSGRRPASCAPPRPRSPPAAPALQSMGSGGGGARRGAADRGGSSSPLASATRGGARLGGGGGGGGFSSGSGSDRSPAGAQHGQLWRRLRAVAMSPGRRWARPSPSAARSATRPWRPWRPKSGESGLGAGGGRDGGGRGKAPPPPRVNPVRQKRAGRTEGEGRPLRVSSPPARLGGDGAERGRGARRAPGQPLAGEGAHAATVRAAPAPSPSHAPVLGWDAPLGNWGPWEESWTRLFSR